MNFLCASLRSNQCRGQDKTVGNKETENGLHWCMPVKNDSRPGHETGSHEEKASKPQRDRSEYRGDNTHSCRVQTYLQLPVDEVVRCCDRYSAEVKCLNYRRPVEEVGQTCRYTEQDNRRRIDNLSFIPDIHVKAFELREFQHQVYRCCNCCDRSDCKVNYLSHG